MNTQLLNSWPMDQLDSAVRATAVEWLWEGYLARGSITLLTGVWKGGKTTLVAGLLRALVGGSFLDRTCAAARALVVSEEAPSHWIERRQAIPIGPHVQLVSRPFPGRPTQEQWDELVGKIEAHRSAVAIDVLVVDSLAVFLPGNSESDPVALNALFQPLRRLANAGVGVLILHHPRKRKAEEGKSARGGETLLEMVDIALELSRHGSSPAEACQRKLVGRSCYPETPRTLIYEWTPGTAHFRTGPVPRELGHGPGHPGAADERRNAQGASGGVAPGQARAVAGSIVRVAVAGGGREAGRPNGDRNEVRPLPIPTGFFHR
jgi:hypothetical protein